MAPTKRLKRRKIRLKKKRKPTIWRHLFYGFLSILAFILICAGIWYLTRLSFFTISSIDVSGGATISHDEVKKTVEDELSGNYFLLIPHRFTYFYPHDGIVTKLSKIPKIYDVNVERSSRTELSVSFKEYIPAALWCLSLEDDANCYYVSDKGYAFAPAPPLDGGTFVRYIFEGADTLGEKQLFTEKQVTDTDTFINALDRDLGFRIGAITFTKVGDVIYYINGGGEFLAAGSMSIQDTFDNLKSVLDSDEYKHLKPGNFSYIDLRFGNKVFVNEELGVNPEETSSSTEATSTEGNGPLDAVQG